VNEAGIHRKIRNSVGDAAPGGKFEYQVAMQGSKLVTRFEAMEADYRSFHDMLDAQNRRLRDANDSQATASRVVIVLEKGFEHPEWGNGNVVANFSRNSNPYSKGPHYHTHVLFQGYDSPGILKHIAIEEFGATALPENPPEKYPGAAKTAQKTNHPGVALMPVEWTPDNVAELQDQLTEILPNAQATFDLLLAKACDPKLNPNLAQAAQTYRDDLIGPD